MTAKSSLATAVLATAMLLGLAVAATQAASKPPQPPPTDKEIIDSPIAKPAPAYPMRAIDQRIEGVVTLEVVLAPNGDMTSVTVVKAEPPGWFEDAALTAVKQWKYRAPGRVMHFKVQITFELPPEMRAPPKY